MIACESQPLPLKRQQFREEFSNESTLVFLNHDISHQTLRNLVVIRVFLNVFGVNLTWSSVGDVKPISPRALSPKCNIITHV